MLKGSMKKLVVSILGAGIMLTTAIPAFASDDNINFSFSIKSYYANSYSSARYRQTTNTKNKWKVNFTYSGEGSGTITTYWLAKSSNNSIASSTHDVKQGSGSHYYTATNVASKTDVKLAAENNNYSASSYTVSGYWDEETN